MVRKRIAPRRRARGLPAALLLLLAATVAIAACSSSGAVRPGDGVTAAATASVTTPTPGVGAPPASAAAVSSAPTHPAGTSSAATSPAATPASGNREVTITVRDGTKLTALVGTPAGPGLHPLALVPSPWGFPDSTYTTQINDLVKRGYVVVSYNTRGFFSSGGTVDVGGPLDVTDASDIITWALANTPADPQRIGAAGLSYGAGIALLAAGADPRVKAVASLSGWTDLAYSLYAANTRHKAAVNLLETIRSIDGQQGQEVTDYLNDYSAQRNMQAVLAWAKIRGASRYLSDINARKVPIFLAAGYNDNFFSPIPQIEFFTSLTGPKALRLAPGDHANNEFGGLFGFPSALWSSAWDWFDRYLRPGSAAAKATAPPAVQITVDGGAVETYPDWASVTRSTSKLRLGPAVFGTGGLSATAPTGTWSTTINSGTDTTANAGLIFVGTYLQEVLNLPAPIRLFTVNRADGAVWEGAAVSTTQRIRGVPTLDVTLTPNVDTGTIVAYLYDTAPDGGSEFISKGVYSYLEATPGQALKASVTFDPLARDLLPGHRLSLVIDTKDSLYTDLDRSGGTVAFSSPTADPSALNVPLG
ncbi:X-Pro dipeptidyl-peptidase domain protein [Frankia sp. AiPs1]|uniref:CocE/NonD family hydrolase n=1 Tax=Frankia sp. AiPa1 TaxID=573492 RepID=UPI00202B9DE4|nr:CocE/NonD family hydrolase [Frankia sp. AiPa1]MCL9758783.1 alpha/beta hydrolase [Frankia sp. AiPa1]